MSSATVRAALATVAAVTVSTGCATVFSGSRSDVRIITQPPGAHVYANGALVGETPLEIELKSMDDHSIEIKKDGYATRTVMVTGDIGGGWIVLDILLGFWPLIIDAITGAWYGLEPDDIHAVLEPRAPGPGHGPPAAPGTATFGGTRRSLSASVKCAAMPLQTAGVDENLATVVDDILLAELQKAGFEAMGPDDINAMLGFERTKEALGCDDATCIAEIGGALGVDYLVAGKIATIDGAPIVTLKLLDVKQGRVLARSNRAASSGEGAVVRLLGEAVQEIVVSSKL